MLVIEEEAYLFFFAFYIKVLEKLRIFADVFNAWRAQECFPIADMVVFTSSALPLVMRLTAISGQHH